MIYVAIFITTILLLACAIKYLFKFEIETSIFMTVCTIALVIAISAIIGILQVGIYAVYTMTVLAGIYFVIYVIKKRKQIKKIFVEVFTPGTIIFILVCFAYYVFVQDKVLTHDDEAASWVFEIKHMFVNGVFKDCNSHNNIIGFFTLYNVKMVGYSEPYIFLSLWIFTWSCLILALRNIKWDKWHKALIFAFGSYCVLNLITTDPSYYMDTVLGILAGAICVSWSYNNIKRQDYVWLAIGLVVLVNIKDELGAVISMMATLFCVVCNIIRFYSKPKEQRRFSYLDLSLNVGLVIVISYFVLKSGFGSALLKLVSSVSFKYIIVGTIPVIIALALIIVFRTKMAKLIKAHYKIIIGVTILTLIIILCSVFSVLYSNIPIDSWRKVKLLLFRLCSENIFNKSANLLVIYSVIYVIFNCVLLLKKKHIRSYAIQSGMVISMVVIYAIALMLGYMLTTGNLFDHWMHSFTRYYIPIFIFASIWFLAKMLNYDREYKYKFGALVSSLVLIILFANQLPVLGNTAFINLESERYVYTYKLRPDLAEQSNSIKQYVDKDDKLLIICSTDNNKYDPFTVMLWMNYELLPINTGRIILTGGSDYMYTNSNKSFSSTELVKYILDDNFSYVYMYSKNQFFEDEYDSLMESSDANSNILFKVTPENKHLLTLVDAIN